MRISLNLLRWAFVPVLVLVVSSCEGVQDTSASVPAHRTTEKTSLIASVPPRAVTVAAFTMRRGVGELPGRIGERTTIGNVTMGYVTLSPPPEVLFTNAVKAELTSAGHSVSGGPSKVSGTVVRFALSTPATAMYWDVTIDVAVSIKVNAVTRQYSKVCVERTYAWPSDKLISGLSNECVGAIMSEFRNDRSVADAL